MAVDGAALSVRLLGSFDIRHADGAECRPAGAKTLELLAYLLLERGRPVSRDRLSTVLWPGADDSHGRKYLRQALWHLQTGIGSGAGKVLDVRPDSVSCRAERALQVDLTEFRVGVDRVRGVAGADLDDEGATSVKATVELYRGPLLGDLAFDWCLLEREWLITSYLSLLDKLMTYAAARRRYDTAIDCGERILRVDPAREYTHRRLMFVHHARGDRTGALRQFARCAEALERELGVPPGRATVELHRQVRADRDPTDCEPPC